MVRLLARTALTLVANAVGLLVASFVVKGFSVNGFSFVVAVLFFSASTIVLGPLIIKITMQNANYLMGGIALVTTFVGLLLTTVFTDGLSINGISAWLASTFIVWVFSVLANVLLPLVLFKKILSETKN
ncbi:hypothetical protein EB118_18070 [bacterium]|nr:hypothetical protein [bacterium]NDC94274.1 hypothetical protein [bacterium]NDD85282.1 hypothetical protein [bacterium]NDG31966.1 hypothetical protein [bacterium]